MWCDCSDGTGVLLEKYEGSCLTFRHTVPASTHAVCARISWWISDSGAGRVDVYSTWCNFWSNHKSQTFIYNQFSFLKRVLNRSWIKSYKCQLKKVHGSLGIGHCKTCQNYDIFWNISIFLSSMNNYRFYLSFNFTIILILISPLSTYKFKI